MVNHNGFCRVEELREIVHQQFGWEDSEGWIIKWFNEAFGSAWICFGADDYEVSKGVCYLQPEGNSQDFFRGLMEKVQHYGYRPVTEGDCQELFQKAADPHLDSSQLLDTCATHPAFKVYQYGETYIGLKAWTWFAPEKPTTIEGQADLVEWYLRMTNELATAKAIADGKRVLGNFRLTAFDVVDVCEQ